MNRLIHTPEGVRDYYNYDCAAKQEIGSRLDTVIKSYGYNFIQTPIFEYYDIFAKERGSASSREMFKFFDNNNDTLVLRPDITPSVARAVAKYYEDEDMPIRLAYHGNTFCNSHSYRGAMMEMTNVGCELFNDDTTDADAEIIAMVIDCLRTAGLKEYQVEIGNIEFFLGLVEEAGLDNDEASDLRTLIATKNYPGIDKMLKDKAISDELRNTFLMLPKLYGTMEDIDKIAGMTGNARALAAVERLKKVYQLLSYYNVQEYVSFDLSNIGAFKYYTGITFEAYSYGTGQKILTGGRYDRLVKQYGKDCAAVGFAIKLDVLMLALSRQKIDVQTDLNVTMVVYDRSRKAEAVALAEKLRKEGNRVQLLKKFNEKTMDDYQAYAKREFCDKIYYCDADGTVTVID